MASGKKTFARRDALRSCPQSGVVAWRLISPDLTLPETDFRRCVRNRGGQVRSFG